MQATRTIVAFMIALAVAVAPLGSASAALRVLGTVGHGGTAAASAVHEHAGHPAAGTAEMDMAEMDMADCASMINKTSDKSTCPCCDTDKACSADLCLFKCFKVFSGVIAQVLTPTFAALFLHPGEPLRPPDWIESPQPPPPRT